MESETIHLIAQNINKLVQEQAMHEMAQSILTNDIKMMYDTLSEPEKKFVTDHWGINFNE